MKLHSYVLSFALPCILCLAALAAESAPPDVLGLAVPLRAAGTKQYSPRILQINQLVSFPLKDVPAGSYHLAVELRSADETGEDGKAMLGGYNFFLPKPSYTITLNGEKIAMELSPRPPIQLKDDSRTKKPVYAGWLVSSDSIDIKTADRLAIRCSKAGGVVRRIMLLDAKAWDAENMRGSDIPAPRSDVGWGTRLFNHLPMKQWYRLGDLDDVIRAMELFSDGFTKPYLQGNPFANLIAEGKELHKHIESYRSANGNDTAAIEQGAGLAKQWQEYFVTVDKTLREVIPPVAEKIQVELDFQTKGIKLNPACWSGREGEFNRDVALQYLNGAETELKKIDDPSDLAKLHIVYLLTYVDNAAEFAKLATEFASQAQETVEFPEYFVSAANSKNQPCVPATQFPRGEVCLNGMWDFSINNGPDNPPKPNEWPRKQRVPHEVWGFGINKDNLSDEQWLKQARGYWQWWENNVWYHNEFDVPADWSGRRLVIAFEETEGYVEVFINGINAGHHRTGLIPFEIDVTDQLVPGARNNILVFVISPKKTIRPGINYRYITLPNLYPTKCTELYSGGITGEVYLRSSPQTYIADTYVRTWADKRIRVENTIKNDTAKPVDQTVTNVISKDGKDQFTLPTQTVHLEPGEEKSVVTEAIWPDAQLWGIGGDYGSPKNLYSLISNLGTIDTIYTEFGFRELTIEGPNFYLNGVRLMLQGDNFLSLGRDHGRRCQWYVNQLYRLQRQANINFTRAHQQSMFHGHAEIANRIGILLEPEACGWYLHPPSDIISQRTDPEQMKYTWPYRNRAWEDPVWRNNYRNYYRELVKRYRNDPSVVIFSAENECMDRWCADTIYQFTQWMKEVAPHLIIDCHSNESAWDDRFEMANFHDYDLYVPRMEEWARVSGPNHKPIIIGEFWNTSLTGTMRHGSPGEARGAEFAMSKWVERRFSEYMKKLNAGVMFFTFDNGSGALYSNANINTAGPWGDLLAKGENFVHPIWPSMSGRGGYRVEKFLTSPDIMGINYNDPTRVAATPTQVFKAYQKVFQEIPGWSNERQPELIVTVLQGGKPVAGVNVFLAPKAGQATAPVGVETDANGTAWFIAKQPGLYSVQVSYNGKIANNDVTLETTEIENRGGFEYIPRATIDMDQPDTMTVALPEKTPLIRPKPAKEEANLPPLPELEQGTESVSPDGFLRDWMLCGPFMGGGRNTEDQNVGWAVDYLTASGGELDTAPDSAATYPSDFKETEYAYWESTKFDVNWRRYVSPDDYIDLGKAFVRNDVKGLDFAPAQFIVGYAACTIDSPSEQDIVITIGSDDGYKLFLNHKLLAANRTYRGATKDEDKIPAHLKQGKNLLLLKVEQDVGGYGFFLRILDKANQPLKLAVENQAPQYALEKDGWVRHWLLCGPFANPGRGLNETTWTTDYLVADGVADCGEEKINPTEGGQYVAEFAEDSTVSWTPGKATLAWRAAEAQKDGFVNLGKEFVTDQIEGLNFPPVEYVLGYAAMYVYCDAPTKARLEIDTINGVKAWLNHQKVFEKHVHRYNTDPASPNKLVFEEGNYFQDVELKQGKNVLLLKLDVANGPYQFRCRFVDENNQPISNLHIGV